MRTKKFYDYIIYSDGRIFSLIRKRFLKPRATTRGYLQVHLKTNNESKFHNVHRLVAEAFIPNLNNLETVNHKDLNKTNNHVDNLEWLSRGDNVRDARKKKKWKSPEWEKLNYVPKGMKCKIGDKEFISLRAAMRYLGYKTAGAKVYKLIDKGVIEIINKKVRVN